MSWLLWRAFALSAAVTMAALSKTSGRRISTSTRKDRLTLTRHPGGFCIIGGSRSKAVQL